MSLVGSLLAGGDDDDVEEPPIDIPASDLFELLSARRRRAAIQVLAETGPISQGDLAEEIGEREYDVEPGGLHHDQRKRVYVGLYQCHLDKLAEAGLIDWNKDRGHVRPTEQLDAVAKLDEEVDARTVDDPPVDEQTDDQTQIEAADEGTDAEPEVLTDGGSEPISERGEGLVDALQEAGAHEDLIAYVHKARSHGGTGLLTSLQTFHRGGEGDVSKLAKLGTEKEKVLWRSGAAVALDHGGVWDVTNQAILQEIVDKRVASEEVA